MADNRTNYVKIENLPPGLPAGELHDYFDPFGSLLEMTATSPSSLVVTYMRRSAAYNCVELVHNQLYVGRNPIRASYYYPREDPMYRTSPLLQGLGKNIGREDFVYDYRTFLPWKQPDQQQQSNGGAQGCSGLHSGGGARPRASAAGSFRGIVIGGPHSKMLYEHTVPWMPPRDGKEAEECSICLDLLGDPRTYDVSSNQERSLSLNKCFHAFHQKCLESMMSASPSPFLQCPNCKRVYGTRTGTRPLTGTICHRLIQNSLPGHGCRTLEITFNFRQGTQGPEHPHPGKPFHPVGFPRKAYIPDNEEGVKALHGIYLAWEQRLLFKVGTSLTNGMDNVITWDDIHLKTRLDPGDHGFPDPHFFTNFFEELEGFGLTEASISSHMHQHPGLKNKGSM